MARSIHVRAATPADLGALRDVYRRSSLSNERDRPHLLAHPEVLEWPDDALAEGRTHVAVIDSKVVGFVSVIDHGDTVEVDDLFVEPDVMRAGVGRALVLDMASRLPVRIEVVANPHARAFYERVGFSVDGEVATTFGTGLRMHRDPPA